MRVLDDHHRSIDVVREACELLQGGSTQCVSLTVALPPEKGNKVFAKLSVFTECDGAARSWKLAWEIFHGLHHAYALLKPRGVCDLVCRWELDDEKDDDASGKILLMASMRLMSRLAVLMHDTGGGIYMGAYGNAVPGDANDAA